MIRTHARSWVWRSTADSRAAGLVSVLAVAETLFCVAVYWALVLWLGATWHHWLILIATPLVLLRSEQSVALGVKWFKRYRDDLDSPSKLLSPQGFAVIGFAFAISGILAWGLAETLLVVSSGWGTFGRSLLIAWISLNLGTAIGIAIVGAGEGAKALAGAVAGAVAGTLAGAGDVIAAAGAASVSAFSVSAFAVSEALAVAVFAPGVAAGLWLRATVTRFAATARYLLPGVLHLPSNWRFSMLVSDVQHPPELIPGDEELVYGVEVSLSWQKLDGSPKSVDDWLLDVIGSVAFFVPAILWRWSIKSTAWFYLPLLWVRRGWLNLEGDELLIWAQSYSDKVLNWLWLIFGGLAIAALAVGLFNLEKWLTLQDTTSASGAPMTVLGFLWSLDWTEVLTQPWMWFYGPSYALTVLIFFALDSIAADIRAGASTDTRAAQIARWKWAANTRAVLTNFGLLVALWYFLGAVDAWEQVTGFFGRVLGML